MYTHTRRSINICATHGTHTDMTSRVRADAYAERTAGHDSQTDGPA
jgi:hypothetical protein